MKGCSMFTGRVLFLAPFALWIVLGLIGCREKEPPLFQHHDLGDETRSLLPTQSPWLDQAVAKGKAQWVPFQEPDSEQAEPDNEEAAKDEERDSPDSDVESQVRDLVADYNDAAADRDLDGLLELHVESQAKALRPFFRAGFAIFEKLEKLRDVLAEKLPDRKDHIEEVFAATLDAATRDALNVTSLEVVSETEVKGTLAPNTLTTSCRFVLIDGDWYLELLNLPDLTALLSANQMVEKGFDMALQQIASGQIPAEQMLKQMEAQMAMLKAQQGGAPGSDSTVPPGGNDK